MKNQPNYYAVLPANVRYCEALPPMAKILFAEITALSNRWGYCTATNKYFQGLYKKGERTIKRLFSQLQEQGFINVEIERTKEGTYRKIYPLSDALQGGAKNGMGGRPKMAPQKNNTSNNNKLSKDSKKDILLGATIGGGWKTSLIDAFYEFMKMRKDIKSPLKTKRGIQTKINRIAKYLETYGHEKTLLCVNCSIDNEWKDIKMDWYERYTNNQPSQKTDSAPNSQPLSLETYLLANSYREKDIRHMRKSGEYQRYEKQYSEAYFQLTNIAKAYPNPTFTQPFLFEVLYMPLGRCLNGSTPDRKLNSLKRWIKDLSDYNRNKGNLRELLKEHAKRV